jgi:hypothetical protein
MAEKTATIKGVKTKEMKNINKNEIEKSRSHIIV